MTSPRLMVVDDEVDMGEFVCAVAEKEGFKAINTDRASDFIEQFHDDTAVVVLDLFMPDVDGIELIRFLGKRQSKALIILMSGVDMSVLHSARELAVELGLDVIGTLTKPFRRDDLRDLLSKTSCKPGGLAQGLPASQAPHEMTEDDLRQAIASGDLTTFFQPQVELISRSVVGAEALVRWRHPEYGLISPSCFIPLAEKTGLVDAIADVVLPEAVTQCRIWHDAGMPLRVSVNICPETLRDLSFPEKLLRLMDEHNLDPASLVIEITENTMINDISRSLDILTRIRMKGLQLSIDDFGTGHSSLEKLARIPFTELKIDQSFIKNIDYDKESRTIAKLSVMLAHEMNMSVIAEGIETEAAWDILIELGCDHVQGFWIGRPMPPEAFLPWCKNWLEGQTGCPDTTT